MHPDWQSVQRLLLLCVEDLDAVLALEPAVRSLRQTLPTAEIHLLSPHPVSAVDSLALYLTSVQNQELSVAPSTSISLHSLISTLRAYRADAAIVFTAPARSPHAIAYLCYLAGVPLRLGQSVEFGGGVLSPWVKPPGEPVSLTDYYLHLLTAAGLAIAHPPEPSLESISQAQSHAQSQIQPVSSNFVLSQS